MVIEDNEAVAVQFIKDGQYYVANASKEIILSAGAVSSPQILMLSGIGSTVELEKHGIEVISSIRFLLSIILLFLVQLIISKFFCRDEFQLKKPFRTYEVYYNSTIP